ncbi:MAG: hypothetical protein EAX91_00825, partial [Candidatus Lokiarchaeota archaeon]|nr:hypothetical protein [Candidatus Lokiarchaeota archaeon]
MYINEFNLIINYCFTGESNMKSHTKSIKAFSIALGILFVFLPITKNPLYIQGANSIESYENKKNLEISAVSGKIHINSNWSTAKAAGICTGKGTYSDPYVIEDF